MQDRKERGWLKRALERASEEIGKRPIWMKPEQMRFAEIQKMKLDEPKKSDSDEN